MGTACRLGGQGPDGAAAPGGPRKPSTWPSTSEVHGPAQGAQRSENGGGGGADGTSSSSRCSLPLPRVLPPAPEQWERTLEVRLQHRGRCSPGWSRSWDMAAASSAKRSSPDSATFWPTRLHMAWQDACRRDTHGRAQEWAGALQRHASRARRDQSPLQRPATSGSASPMEGRVVSLPGSLPGTGALHQANHCVCWRVLVPVPCAPRPNPPHPHRKIKPTEHTHTPPPPPPTNTLDEHEGGMGDVHAVLEVVVWYRLVDGRHLRRQQGGAGGTGCQRQAGCRRPTSRPMGTKGRSGCGASHKFGCDWASGASRRQAGQQRPSPRQQSATAWLRRRSRAPTLRLQRRRRCGLCEERGLCVCVYV